MCLFILGYLLLQPVREKCEVTKTLFRCQTGSLISLLEYTSDALSDRRCVASSCFSSVFVLFCSSVCVLFILFCKELRQVLARSLGKY